MKQMLCIVLCLMLCLPVMAAASPTETPAPVELVTAQYKLRSTPKFVNEEATLRVFSDGTSEMTLRFTNAYGHSFNMPDDAFIRLTKVDGEEGNYGQAPLVLTGENNSSTSVFSATVPFDRAFGKSEYITFFICKPDGTELQQLRYVLDEFDSTTGKWPAPESTPALATIPPVAPTPTPTPRPTLAPDTTEPPQDNAVVTATFKMREYTDKYTEMSAKLRVYPDDISALTVQFKYGKEIPEGTVFRLTTVDGKLGFYGEGLISPADDKGRREAVILFNQQVGPMKNINLEAFAPGSQRRLFKAFYKLSGSISSTWSKMDPISTVMPAATPTPSPLPENVSPTPPPTEPPQKNATSQARFALMDPVKWFSLKSAIHRRYDNGLSAVIIQFRYNGELPAKPVLRIVQREYTEGNFGEAPVVWGKDDLLTATIVTDQLQGSLRAFRLKCYDEKGNEQFYADFGVTLANEYWDGGTEAAMARAMLPTATPEPTETPVPTPTVAPTADPDVSPTPAPTEPDYSEARSKRKFLLLDKVKGYAHYNVTLRRYAEVDVLTVYFRYNQDLPEGAKLRLTRADTLLDSFGEALIVPAELKNASADLLCAKIPSDRIPLNCIGLRVEAVTAEGEVLFTADFYPEEGHQAETARALLNSEFEEPTASPEASPEATDGEAT